MSPRPSGTQGRTPGATALQMRSFSAGMPERWPKGWERKGLAPEVPAILAAMGPKWIVYVSCDPATLARDVSRLSDLGYRPVKAQGVDLFPRTAHVETVVALTQNPTL